MPSAFFFGENIGFGFEFRVRRDRTRFGDHLPALDFFTLDASQEQSDVIACHSFVEQLFEHLDSRHDRVARVFDADDLHRFIDVHDASLDSTGGNCSATLNGEDVFDRHQKRFVRVSGRRRDVIIYRLHQFFHGRFPFGVAF